MNYLVMYHVYELYHLCGNMLYNTFNNPAFYATDIHAI